MDKEMLEMLSREGACQEAVAWTATQPDRQTAWDSCDRGDWMLWLLSSDVADDVPVDALQQELQARIGVHAAMLSDLLARLHRTCPRVATLALLGSYAHKEAHTVPIARALTADMIRKHYPSTQVEVLT